ncbi:Natural cytotoxicity triggering receptor 3 ligand 1 [Plecturocebus cupreus]
MAARLKTWVSGFLETYSSTKPGSSELEVGDTWPPEGSINYNSLLQLDLFCKREGKWIEFPYVQVFFSLRDKPQLCSRRRIWANRSTYSLFTSDLKQIKEDLGKFSGNPDKYIDVLQGLSQSFKLDYKDIMLLLSQTLTSNEERLL